MSFLAFSFLLVPVASEGLLESALEFELHTLHIVHFFSEAHEDCAVDRLPGLVEGEFGLHLNVPFLSLAVFV